MIQDIVLQINGRDFSGRLSTFSPDVEVTFGKVVTTIDGTEHAGGQRFRDVLTFSLWPSSGATAKEDFDVLSQRQLELTCTSPTAPGGRLEGVRVRLSSNLTNAFALNSVDGQIYYTGEPITLRAMRVR